MIFTMDLINNVRRIVVITLHNLRGQYNIYDRNQRNDINISNIAHKRKYYENICAQKKKQQ